MKLFKRISAMFLAVIMTVAVFGSTTAFAAEISTNNEDIWIDGEYIDLTNINNGALQTLVKQNFSMTSQHTGSTRTYNHYNLAFICNFTDRNGNIPSDGTILAVRLYKSNGELVNEWQGYRGNVIAPTFSINYGGRYYFKYLVAYGTQNLNVEMTIYTTN